MEEGENGVKLRRGRISLERKKEILAQYDQLDGPFSDADVVARFGVTKTALDKILFERDEIMEATVKTPSVDEEGPKMKRGRISFEKQKELLHLYDQLPECTISEAASKLCVKEVTLSKMLASRNAGDLRGKKRKKAESDSASDSDSYFPPQRGCSPSNMVPGSPQPGSSGVQRGTSRTSMDLRKGRRVRVDYSEDEQSGSDYRQNSDLSDDEVVEENFKKGKKKKYYTAREKQMLLAKYDEMTPCPQWRAAEILGITKPTLSNWLQQRSLATTKAGKPKREQSQPNPDDSDVSGEEIDSYVLGSKGSQVVQFFEVAGDDGKPQDSNLISRKPHLTLREKFELYKEYDSMDPDSQRNAAAKFKLNKSTWFNLITNRYYYEQQLKKRLRKDKNILNKYDELENKRGAAKVLGLSKNRLSKLLENRDSIEGYFTEKELCSNEDEDSIAASVEETEFQWKYTKELKALERQLLEWYKESKDEEVNWKVLKEKAKELAVKSGMDFHPSDAWLKKWNKTNRVFWSKKGKLVAIYGFGGNPSLSECVLMALKDYPPENLFNLVETGLYYRAVPGHAPLTKDWVVAGFACNMSGTEKKKLLVVGKSQAPLCFRVLQLPLEYKCSPGARVTEEILTAYLQDWDRELDKTKRKIALVLDSSTSHANVHLSNIRLFFVPVGCSAAQPLFDGIVGQVKAHCRKRMAESLLSVTNVTDKSPAEGISVVDALFSLSEAWGKLPKSLLVAKFLKCAFPQNDMGEPHPEELDDEELERLNKLDEEIQVHSDGPCPDEDITELEPARVVKMEGTLNLSEAEDFDIDGLLDFETAMDEPTPVSDKTPNGSVSQKGRSTPTTADVCGALATIKKFLHLNACTLEDLTDYAQLEKKVLSKIKDMSAATKLS